MAAADRPRAVVALPLTTHVVGDVLDADLINRNRHGRASWPMPAFATARPPGRYAGTPQGVRRYPRKGGTAVPHFNANVPRVLTRVDTPSHPRSRPTPRYPRTPPIGYSGTTPRVLHYPRTSAMITTPSSNRPIRPPPSPTPPAPSRDHPTPPPTPVQQFHLRSSPPASQNLALVRRARGWDTGFTGQQAGDDGDPLQTLRAPTVPRPATPHRMQEVYSGIRPCS